MNDNTSKPKNHNPVFYAGLGVALLALAFLFGNILISKIRLGNNTMDFTENKMHSLSKGTKAILKELSELETEVVINYYATRDVPTMPREIELFIKKVDFLLERYESLSDGKVKINNLDPKPDTDAEDAADLDGMAGQRISEYDNIYCGLSIQYLERKEAIPFLSPENETQLEYQISKAIARVSNDEVPVVGIMSPFQLAESMIPGVSQNPGWVFYKQLQSQYDVRTVPMKARAEDLEGLRAVVLFHPAGITPEVEYVLDQYLLSGGNIVACLDPYSHLAKIQAMRNQNPTMSPPPIPPGSNLPKLLSAWGVEFSANEVVGDSRYKTAMRGGSSPAVLTLTPESMPEKDNIITKNLATLLLPFAGSYTVKGAEGVTATTLVRSSRDSGLLPASDSTDSMGVDALMKVKQDDKAHDLVVHLSGNFKTAFPDGAPTQVKENTENKEGEEKEEDKVVDNSLKESKKKGNVFLFPDVDFLANEIAFRQDMFGRWYPVSDSPTLFFNLLDQIMGSKHLIGSRSRTSSFRPFTVITKMESDFEKKFGEEQERLVEEINEAKRELGEMVQQRQQEKALILDDAAESKVQEIKQQIVDANKELRELQKELRRDKDKLSAKVTLLNVVVMPLLVFLLGVFIFIRRRQITRAR